MTERLHWPSVVARAAVIVDTYDTPVTLRQLFYRLVAAEVIPNNRSAYSILSRCTAQARRAGTFPDLVDLGRGIHVDPSWTSPRHALDDITRVYRRDRTEGQRVSVYLAVEKVGLVAQLAAWFADLGVPILALSGYPSQSYVGEVRADVATRNRPAVLLYAGDFDPSGEDIARDFTARTDCWAHAERVALTPEQITGYGLPPLPGKATDARASAFTARHGRLVQVELDALDPVDLRDLFTRALAPHWDSDTYRRAIDRERDDRQALSRLARTLDGR